MDKIQEPKNIYKEEVFYSNKILRAHEFNFWWCRKKLELKRWRVLVKTTVDQEQLRRISGRKLEGKSVKNKSQPKANKRTEVIKTRVFVEEFKFEKP